MNLTLQSPRSSENGGLTEKQRKLLNRVENCSRYFSELVGSLLEYIHLESGLLSIETFLFDIGELANEIFGELPPWPSGSP